MYRPVYIVIPTSPEMKNVAYYLDPMRTIVKMASAIGKCFTSYGASVVKQTEYFLYRWWAKYGTIAGIVQRLDIWTNSIGFPSEMYDIDMTLI